MDDVAAKIFAALDDVAAKIFATLDDETVKKKASTFGCSFCIYHYSCAGGLVCIILLEELFSGKNNFSGEYLSTPINSFDSKYKNSPSYTIAKKYNLKMPENLPIELYNCSKNLGNFSPKYSIGLKLKNKPLSKKEILPCPGYYYNERNHKLL